MAKQSQSTVQDTGYSWVILAASCFLAFILGCVGSTGVYFVEFVEHFDNDGRTLAWIGACQFSSLGFAGFIAGPLIKLYSCRAVVTVGIVLQFTGYIFSIFTDSIYVLYLTFGILAGTGIGFFNVAAPVSINQYFNQRRSTANGIFVACISLGVFIWPLLVERLIYVYAWRGALAIQGAMCLNGLVAAGLLRPFSQTITPFSTGGDVVELTTELDVNRTSKTDEATGQPIEKAVSTEDNQLGHRTRKTGRIWTDVKIICSSLIDLSLLKNQIFLLHCLATFCQEMAHFGVVTFLPLRGVSVSANKQEAAFLASLSGICSGVSRLAVGALGDKIARHRALLAGVGAFAAAVLCTVSVSFTNYQFVACFAAGYGLMAASYIATMFSLVVDILGIEHVAKGTGILIVSVGFANLVNFPLCGLIIDSSGNIAYIFLLFGVFLSAGGLFFCIVNYLLAKRHRLLKKSRVFRETSVAGDQQSIS